MRIRTDGDYEWRAQEIDTAADWWDCNKTAALMKSAETVRFLDEGIQQVLARDDLTPAQKREIADTLSTPSLRYDYEENVEVEK